MEPTVGRIVLVSLQLGASASTAISQPQLQLGASSSTAIRRTCPAIVCEVHSPSCISVQAFHRNGVEFVYSVVRSEGLADNGAYAQWDWMPYQKAVAAEREAEGKPDLNTPGSTEVSY